MLQVSDLKKHFGGVKAVDNCSFYLQEGKITVLIGPNGSGKTTIFNLISGVLKPDKGQITLDDRNITNQSVEKISNQGISRIFQKSRLFGNLTVKDNLLLACNREDTNLWKSVFSQDKTIGDSEIRIEGLLKALKLQGCSDKLAKTLSFGQKRLIEIVRAMVKPHTILMLDEPIAGVAPLLRVEIASLLRTQRQNGDTIFIIEHDMDFVLGLADEIIVMDDGKIIAQGCPDQVKRNKKVLNAYLGE